MITVDLLVDAPMPGNSIRFYRHPDSKTGLPWVDFDDLCTSVGMTEPDCQVVLRRMQADWPAEIRTARRDDAIVRIVSNMVAQTLIDELIEADWLERRWVPSYAQAAATALQQALAHLRPEERLPAALAAFGDA